MILIILESFVAVALIVVILLQAQGSGLSASFGGTGESFRSRRSVEKLLVAATIILAIVFAFLSILLLIP
ncbi:MAG: preprotein translocase subunit SecG [Candidatus Levybacteria bacterium]|nr:preprotein translocase subunit SecG [Candidatus Levybacteria bacterium]